MSMRKKLTAVEIARRVRVPIPDAEVRRIITKVIASAAKQTRGEGLPYRPDRHVGAPRNDRAMSVAFVSPQEMRRLNRTYHSEDRVTDVLAFGGEGELGELIMCPSYVKAQAKRAGEPFRRELTRVLVHGTLHLLGHDHATPREAERMFGMQEEIVRSC